MSIYLNCILLIWAVFCMSITQEKKVVFFFVVVVVKDGKSHNPVGVLF